VSVSCCAFAIAIVVALPTGIKAPVRKTAT